MTDLFTYKTLLLTVVILFVVMSTIMTLVTLGNAVRLRSVRMTWKSGKLAGYPLFSTLFLFGFLILLISSLHKQIPIDGILYMSYFWIGLNWFVSGYLSTKRYITDHGIVKNINDPSQTIAWNQIYDFFEQKGEKHDTFIFFYRIQSGTTSEFSRIELTVPKSQFQRFRKILLQKLGRRFSVVGNVKMDLPFFR